VSFRPTGRSQFPRKEINLRQLWLQPADLLAIIGDDRRHDNDELDDRILRHAVCHFAPRPYFPVGHPDMDPKARTQRCFLGHACCFASFRNPAIKIALASRHTDPHSDERVEGQGMILSLSPTPTASRIARRFANMRNNLAAFSARAEGPLSDLANRRGRRFWRNAE